MRTTLTIDDDVAVQLERLQKERDLSLKDVVNEALRRGLGAMREPAPKRKPFRTKTSDMGRPLINIDNTWDVIARLEGGDFK